MNPMEIHSARHFVTLSALSGNPDILRHPCFESVLDGLARTLTESLPGLFDHRNPLEPEVMLVLHDNAVGLITVALEELAGGY